MKRYPIVVWSLLLTYCLVSGRIVAGEERMVFPAGPQPSADAPAAVAVDSLRGRLYVVHRSLARDVKINDGRLPTNRVSVIDQKTGVIITTLEVGHSLQGPGQGIAMDSNRHRVYVANTDEHTVSIIDSAVNSVVATIDLGAGQGPMGIAADPQKGRVYVANSEGKNVTILDSDSGKVIGILPLNGGAFAVAVDNRTHLVYVTVRAAPWTVVAIDGETQTIRSQVELPFLFTLSGIAVDSGRRVYVSDFNTGLVSMIDISRTPPKEINRFSGGKNLDAVAVDPSTHQVYVAETFVGSNNLNILSADGAHLKTIKVLRLPMAIAIDEAARRVYVANMGSDSLSVLDADHQTLIDQIGLGTLNFGLAYDSTTERLYVANYVTDSISVVDATRGTMMADWVCGAGPWAVAVDAGVQQVYSLNADEGTLSVLSRVTGQIKGKVDVGPGTQTVAVNPRTHRVYTTSSNGLTVIDGASNQVVTTVAVGDRPVGIAIDDSSGRIYVANQQSGTISVIAAETHQLVATWQPELNNVWGLAVDAAVNHLYVTIPPNVTGAWTGLEVLNLDTGALIAQIATGSGAELVAIHAKTHRVYVTDDDGTVSIVDGVTCTRIEKVIVGNGPHGLSVDEASGRAYVGCAFDGVVSVIDEGRQPPSHPLR